MLEIGKRIGYIVSTYDVKLICGGGDTEEEALIDYVKSAEEELAKIKDGVAKLEKSIEEAKSKINNKKV